MAKLTFGVLEAIPYGVIDEAVPVRRWQRRSDVRREGACGHGPHAAAVVTALMVFIPSPSNRFAGVAADVPGKGRRALGHPGNLGAAALVFRLVPIEGRSRRRHQSLTCRFRAPVRCSAESMLSRRRCIRRALRASSCHPIGSWNAPHGPSKPQQRLPAPPLGVPSLPPPSILAFGPSPQIHLGAKLSRAATIFTTISLIIKR